MPVLLAFTACAEPGTPEYDEQEARLACLEQASTIPSFETAAKELESIPERDEDEQDWRVAENGRFVLEVSDPRSNRTNPFVFTCAGNMETRTIEFLQLGQDEIRPNGDEIWSY